MAKEVFEQKSPRPAPVALHANGTAAAPRVSPGNTGKRRSHAGLWMMLFILALAIAGGVYYFYYLPTTQPAETTAQTEKHGHGGASDKIRIVPATATPWRYRRLPGRAGLGCAVEDGDGQDPRRWPVDEGAFHGGPDGQGGRSPGAQLDARPFEAQLAQQKAQKEHDQAVLENAKIDLQRYETLLKQDSVQAQTRDTQVALVKQDQATVDLDQAQIVATQLNITYCNITSPVSGRVGLRLVDEGNQVHASDTNGLLVITQIQPITVVFTIPEDSVPTVMSKLNAGQQLTVDALDRAQKNKLAQGTLLTSDNQIDPATGTLKLKAIFTNEDNALFPNQFVNARLLVETKKNVVLLPVAAIQYGTQGTFVTW